MENKYILINEITQEIIKSSDSLSELQTLASQITTSNKNKSKSLLIKESVSNETVAQYGILLD